MVTSASAADDWDQVYAEVQEDPTAEFHTCADIGADACTWAHDDFAVSVFTTGGSKDDLNINPLPGESGTGWKWTDSSVPDADEILDGFAAKYTDTNDHQLIFFGADRYATNGSKDFGFWFFKQQVGLNANGSFAGNHTRPTLGPDGQPGGGDDTRGDILILGTFSNGGAVTTLRVFEWVGVGGNANGTLQALGTFGDCAAGGGSAEGCNTVNNTTIPSPWPYMGKSAPAVNQIYSGGFMEGGLDLTLLGLEGCFASFMAETRSSPSVDATLKDFVLGNFESCGATIAADAFGRLVRDRVARSATPPPSASPVADRHATRIRGLLCLRDRPGASPSCDATGTAAGHINLEHRDRLGHRLRRHVQYGLPRSRQATTASTPSTLRRPGQRLPRRCLPDRLHRRVFHRHSATAHDLDRGDRVGRGVAWHRDR